MQLVFAALCGGFCGAAQVDVAFVEAGADGCDGGADDGADDVVFRQGVWRGGRCCGGFCQDVCGGGRCCVGFRQDVWRGGRCCVGFCGREKGLGDAGQGEVGDVVFSGKAEDGFVACFYLPDVGGLGAVERGQGVAEDFLVVTAFDCGEGEALGVACVRCGGLELDDGVDNEVFHAAQDDVDGAVGEFGVVAAAEDVEVELKEKGLPPVGAPVLVGVFGVGFVGREADGFEIAVEAYGLVHFPYPAVGEGMAVDGLCHFMGQVVAGIG